LAPTRIYALDCLSLIAETDVRVFSHVTGGGLAENLERVMPRGLVARLDRGRWQVPAVFGTIAHHGRVEQAEMERTFNMGVGMVAVLPAEDVDRAQAVLTARHVDNRVIGRVEECDDAEWPRDVLEGAHGRGRRLRGQTSAGHHLGGDARRSCA